ncbi:MAG: class A beta-lactamase-related serine hydrolase [Bacteroidetes bacterium]|nr:MAG: class A beta-lactamase-related serine hydrolase [Bacteroidota bacterium]
MSNPTKRIVQIALLAGTAISLFFVPWQLVWTWLRPLPDTVQQELEAAHAQGLDGLILCVNQPGEIALHAAGWRQRENKIPADPEALFKIASISKLYIAAATAQLVADGRLSLDQTLAESLPELAPRIAHADAISLRMLVQHRSGIPNFLDSPDFPWGALPVSDLDALDLVLDAPADFVPDQRRQYSNTNYVLIGAILDSTLGYSHHRYIREEILQPLGLHHTYSLLSEVDTAAVMSGYLVDWPSDVKGMDYTLPGGSMVATAEDVSHFLRALIDGSLLSPEAQAIYAEIYEYEHTGSLPGYQSIARYHEDLDAVVVLFVSSSGGDTWSQVEQVYGRVMKILRR